MLLFLLLLLNGSPFFVWPFMNNIAFAISVCGTRFSFWAIAWSEFYLVFRDFRLRATVSVAVSISQATIKYVQNDFSSFFVFFFFFSLCFVCACLPTNLHWIVFYWVPFYIFLALDIAVFTTTPCANFERSASQFICMRCSERRKRKLWPVSCTFNIYEIIITLQQ